MEEWDSSHATNYGQDNGKDHYTVAQSYGYKLTTGYGACCKAFNNIVQLLIFPTRPHLSVPTSWVLGLVTGIETTLINNAYIANASA